MRFSFLLKWVLTIFLIWIILIKINIVEILQVLRSINCLYFIISLFFVPFLCAIRTLRWTLLLKTSGITINFTHAFNIIMIGSFYGLLTPGKLGEFGRILHLGENKSISTASVLIEKMLDIGALLFLSFITILLFMQDEIYFVTLTIIIGIGLIMLFFLSIQELFIVKFGTLLHLDNSIVNQFFIIFKEILNNYPIMLKALGLTFFYYGINYIMGIFIAYSAGFSPLAVISYPIIILIGNIPLTISGFGIRESISSIIFVILGESAADGFVYSILVFFSTTLIPGIWGYFLSMRYKY